MQIRKSESFAEIPDGCSGMLTDPLLSVLRLKVGMLGLEGFIVQWTRFSYRNQTLIVLGY